jgi:hypothetical protein
MKVGDLVKVKSCASNAWGDFQCECFFCSSKSNRIGVVTAVAPRNAYHVMFDTGMWRLDMFDEAKGDVKVIRAAR